jgi:hypothetical protein
MPGSGYDEFLMWIRISAIDNPSIYVEVDIKRQRWTNYQPSNRDFAESPNAIVYLPTGYLSGGAIVNRTYKYTLYTYRSGDDAVYIKNLYIMLLELSNY